MTHFANIRKQHELEVAYNNTCIDIMNKLIEIECDATYGGIIYDETYLKDRIDWIQNIVNYPEDKIKELQSKQKLTENQMKHLSKILNWWKDSSVKALNNYGRQLKFLSEFNYEEQKERMMKGVI